MNIQTDKRMIKYRKVVTVIQSCKTLEQLPAAQKFAILFYNQIESKYGVFSEQLAEICRCLDQHVNQKLHELQNQKTPHRSKTLPRSRPNQTKPPIRTR